MIKKILSWFTSDPVFVLRDNELSDPWKVEMRDALNAKDSNKAANLMLLAEEKRIAAWHPTTRPSRIRFDPNQRWLGLQIKRAERDTVEFVARFKVHGKGHRLHETSRFGQVAGQWYYVDGEIHER